MNDGTWAIAGTVVVALITALVAPAFLEWLRGSQKREASEMETFRKEQREMYQSTRLEYRTLQDAYRDIERRYDELEAKCAELAARLDAQNGELAKLRTENIEQRKEIDRLKEENYRLLVRLASLERGNS